MRFLSGLSLSFAASPDARRTPARGALAAACMLATGLVLSHPALSQERAMDLGTSLAFIAHAEHAAEARHAHVAIAIVDTGGNLVAFQKMDGTQLGSVRLAILKAKTAVNYLRPTADMEHALNAGNYMIATLPDTLPAGGGYPIMVNGKLIGALGLSGGEGETDATLAKEAVTRGVQTIK
ncbi:heme-binding protein [Nguyenibacter sp. L1]|uniref:GlcG/HbpS family heme-binding protein n=1 Tax=Nguyenibacter sp. L1 TaxID=3049350 RepID=UPI002B46B30F|nr:heme-binding protein [Nguyenibacter sp. L1]WRH89002.1 heme-binding protein [Nguyenibacter sp. L1]